MPADFWTALLPDHLLLGLLFAVMALEMLRVDERVARPLLIVTLAAAWAVLLRQYATGNAVTLVADEFRIDRFAVLAKLVIVGCGLLWSTLLRGRVTFKTAFLQVRRCSALRSSWTAPASCRSSSASRCFRCLRSH
jgi:NADH:ubiquinone oxidoreductase subunit 2 (subunit N)